MSRESVLFNDAKKLRADFQSRPLSTAADKQAYRAKLRAMWDELIELTPRFGTHHEFGKWIDEADALTK